MPKVLYTADLSIPNIKSLVVSLADNEKSLVFEVTVPKPDAPPPGKLINVPVSEAQADLLLRLSGKH